MVSCCCAFDAFFPCDMTLFLVHALFPSLFVVGEGTPSPPWVHPSGSPGDFSISWQLFGYTFRHFSPSTSTTSSVVRCTWSLDSNLFFFFFSSHHQCESLRRPTLRSHPLVFSRQGGFAAPSCRLLLTGFRSPRCLVSPSRPISWVFREACTGQG